jgi:nucleotide-binding universal stress UspA family protein
MLKPIRSILFATDLTANCQSALEFTLTLGTRFHATIYMLHVIEKLPDQMSERLKGLLGKHQWEEMVDSHKMAAHKSLLGKQSTSAVVREAIHDFCKQEGIEDNACDFQSREIIVSDGEVIEDILHNAVANECDLIVLGGHPHLFSKSSLGTTAKGVLKRSKIPVTVVPPREA